MVAQPQRSPLSEVPPRVARCQLRIAKNEKERNPNRRVRRIGASVPCASPFGYTVGEERNSQKNRVHACGRRARTTHARSPYNTYQYSQLRATLPGPRRARRHALTERCSRASRQRRHRRRRWLHPRRWQPPARRRAWHDVLRAPRGPQTTRRAHRARGERAPLERLQRQVRRAAQVRELPRDCEGARWERLPRGT